MNGQRPRFSDTIANSEQFPAYLTIPLGGRDGLIAVRFNGARSSDAGRPGSQAIILCLSEAFCLVSRRQPRGKLVTWRGWRGVGGTMNNRRRYTFDGAVLPRLWWKLMTNHIRLASQVTIH